MLKNNLIIKCAIMLSMALSVLLTSNQLNAAQAVKILFITSAHTNTVKIGLLADTAKGRATVEHKSAKSLATSAADASALASIFNQYDVVILNAVSSRESSSTYASYPTAVSLTNSHVVAMNGIDNQALNKGFSNEQLTALQAYWKNAGRVNLTNMGRYILAGTNPLSGHVADIGAPIVFPTQGIYHPKQPKLISKNLAQYHQFSAPTAGQPRIALLMQRYQIETEQTQLIDETIAQLEAKGAYVVPFFFKLSRTSGDYHQLLQLPVVAQEPNGEMRTQVDLIINFRNIHWANQRKVEFEKFAVPVMQALTYYAGDEAAWRADNQGISANMMSFTLVLPENAGVVDPMVVAAINKDDQLEVIDQQLTHMVNKAINLVALKYKANAEKKLTVFVWGDKDVGASFMNIPDSIEAISQRLAAEGYHTGLRDSAYITANIKKILDPFYRDFELNELLNNDLAELMPIEAYLNWFNTLPTAVTEPIITTWGQPQDNFMAIEKEGQHFFVLPRIRNGNMLVMRQPPRSDSKNDENEVFHQGIVPINHFYLAAYFYARQYWQSDAIIHLGTHGSQEYLGGKERGLSMFDQGNLAVWDTPVVYPFIVDDVGEAMQTKRRGRATVISHMTPPFAAAGLEGEIRNLHELMHQYKNLDSGGVKQKTATQLTELCFETNICKDIGWEQSNIAAEFSEFIEDLHLHLEALALANQPLGLHTFGKLTTQQRMIATLIQMLGGEFTVRVSEFEHQQYATQLIGESVDKEDEVGHSHVYHTAQANEAESDITQLSGYLTVNDYIVTQTRDINQLPTPLLQDITRGRELYQQMTAIHELDAMVDFLDNKYIPVKSGGDPIRHPESLATGYNLFGFNPSRVPTKAAYEQGKELVDQMLANYYQKHGLYPDKVAFSLWSIETMRHYGVLEAQVLYAMGVKPKWSASGRVIGTEIIPYSELKRPRVDVVLSATGLYRDAFPSVMQLLAKAINKVAALKEENNSIWQHSQQVKADLIAQGVVEEEAQYLSTIRIFSNQSGDYGSGVDDAAWASDTWTQDSKISDIYLKKMGYFFGADNKRWGEQAVDSHGKDIALYAKQLSGTDIATFSRSSNLFGMLSSDDPFEYFGALSLAVRNIDGKSPDMVISNLRDANNGAMEDAALFLAKEMRTRVFHRRWIKAMQQEGYSGAVSLASRMDNFFGWQVVAPELVRNDQWDEYHDIYVDDKLQLALDQWFKDTNPAALARMMERMLEAQRKEYWDADPARLAQLIKQYVELVNDNDLLVLNETLEAHVNELASGFGLAPLQAVKALPTLAEQVAASQQASGQEVSGQQLQKQKQSSQSVEPSYFIYYALAAMLLLMLAGGLWQAMPRTGSRRQGLPTQN